MTLGAAMKTLKDLRLVPKLERLMQEAFQREFDRVLYSKIQKVVKEFKSVDWTQELKNSKTVYRNGISDLVKAIVDGKIQYIDGRFEGDISSKLGTELRKIGANYDPRLKAYHLKQSDLPMDVSLAVGTMKSAYQNLHKGVIDQLRPADALLEFDRERIQSIYMGTINEYERQFQKAVKGLSIEANITDQMRQNIAKDYTNNVIDLNISEWFNENIVKLRKDVEKNMHAGGRARNLERLLQKNYRQSRNKARFLARNEQALMLSNYRKARYKQAGITRYRWRTSEDERVRTRHRELNGRIFFWDEAIIDNEGTRGNPKETYNCRCTAEPILED